MAEAANKFNLDSTYFVAFEMAHEALRRGLEQASDLNITQYRILTKLMQASAPVSQGELGKILGMKPNVVTQAVDVLVAHGYATREAAVAAAAHIEPPLHAGRAQRFPATRSLVSIELIRAETERTLRDATGASLNECRIVQRLGETDHPERVGTLAEQLMMSPVNAARAVDRLVGRGWAKRLKSPHDKKAVYVALTDEGVYQGFLISATVNELAATKLWVRLTPEQRDAIERVGHVVVADLNAQRQAKEQAAYDLLQEI